MEHEEHVLERPGMYIGSIDKDNYDAYVFDQESKMITKKNDVEIIPGLYKIVDEILVNTVDHAARLQDIQARNPDSTNLNLVKTIKINIDKKSGLISVYNDGNGIEVEQHPEYKIYIPELIFGNLLTSTNYDEKEIKTIGGQNGIGAKACNIYSKLFTIETVDHERQRLYSQEFKDNMKVKGKPSIRKCSKKPYTKITFLPDYERFKVVPHHGQNKDEILSDDMYNILIKRCYDICALTSPDITVWLNDEKLTFKTFEKYIDLYLGSKGEKFRAVEKINDRWEIGVSYNEKIGLEHVSFVNGIWTLKGGKHVDYIANQIANKLSDLIAKRRKNTEVKANHVKNYLMIFVKSIIENPSFDSQSKDALTTPISKFGSKAEVSDKLIEKLYKSDIVDKILNLCDKNTLALTKKTDGKKQNRIRGLAKLDDANFAGTNKSKECVLILTEGDSAKTMALEGLAEVGRDRFGVYPLRGKLMNVKDVADKKVIENKEIQDIKKILGLESGKQYKSTDDLRYGKIMIMTDQDTDGSHIKGLIMNMFHTLWPSLLVQDNFITCMITPIVKVSRGKVEKSFYNLTDYNNWLEDLNKKNQSVREWKIKYYKGLGTSNDEEAKSYFRNMHTVHFDSEEKEKVDFVFDLAFNKKKAHDRKRWIEKYDPQATLELKNDEEHVSYSDFINKELVHFSVYDVKRSIPCLIDGFKPSQRKVLFGAFKRNLTQEAKVSQLAGYISEHAAYHHGEASLQMTIVGMAQDFVGSNNMQFLMPNGMFGSRNMGGKDAAQSRYIYTQIEPITFKTFIKEDNPLLKYLDDDGFPIEPEYYVPIIPTVLVNGAVGIGTGYSTNIPSFNPLDVIDILKKCIDQKGQLDEDIMIHPWYRGFTGEIKPIFTDCHSKNNDDTSSIDTTVDSIVLPSSSMKIKGYSTHGKYNVLSQTSVEITELPIGTWTEDYKEFLENYLTLHPKILKDFESHSTKKVRFILHFYPEELKKLLSDPSKFESEFKLVSKNLSLTNMHLFDENGIIRKYHRIKDIVENFYKVRYGFYMKRKIFNIRNLKDQIEKANARASFIQEVMDNKLQVMRKSQDEVNAMLQQRNYPKIDGDFAYLLKMPIYTFTKEKYEELLKEVDDLQKKLALYESKSEEDIWLHELEILGTEYKKSYEDYILKQESNKNVAKLNTKSGTKTNTKTKK